MMYDKDSSSEVKCNYIITQNESKNYNEDIIDKSSFVNCDNEEIIKQKTISQKAVINEYKNWSDMLCNILNASHNFDYYNQIKGCISKIDNVVNENLILKKAIFNQQLTQENLVNDIIKQEEDIVNIIDFNNKDNTKDYKDIKLLLTEKLNLISNIEVLSKDLDDATEKSDTFIEINNKINKAEYIKKLSNEAKNLKKECESLKLKLIKNNNSNINTNTITNRSKINNKNISSFLSCFPDYSDSYETLILKK